ncbi:MAG: hypothetical protein E6I18_16805 [Chloroflexi bacterium]|nr:MAG: hypothetical protein E6I18_16805 [Chloroflexota bacterium]
MNHRAIWLTAAVLAAVVLLAQIAGAATREETASVTTNATVSAEITRNVATVSLHEQASSVAREKADKDANSDRERAETDETTIEVAVNARAAAPKDGTAASGTRPGWGCGDTKHKHAGPPGRPDATPPPGCTKTP